LNIIEPEKNIKLKFQAISKENGQEKAKKILFKLK